MNLTELPWEPLSPAEVAGLFADVPWWCVAGGHAIELAVGRPLRPHSDIDVLLLRRDQLAAQHALAGWEWWRPTRRASCDAGGPVRSCLRTSTTSGAARLVPSIGRSS